MIDTKNIVSATLLSCEEAEKYGKMISAIKETWWLRSPGYDGMRAACVYNGDVYDNGDYVFREFAVRPALQISNPESLKPSEEFTFGEQTFTYLGEGLALCNNCIGKCAFRDDLTAPDANAYEKSDVKRYVENWFEKVKVFQVRQAPHIDRGWKNDIPVHDEFSSEGESFVKTLMDKSNEEAFQNITAKLILDGWHAIGRPITEFDTYCAENDIPYSRVAAAVEEYGLSMKDEFFDGLESFSREDFRELFDKDIAKYEQLAAEILDDYNYNMCLDKEDFSPALLDALEKWAVKKNPDTIHVTDIQYETDFSEICEYFMSAVRTDKEKAASLLYVSVDELQGMDDEQIADRLYNLLSDSDQFAGTVGLTIYDIFDLPRELEIPKAALKGAEGTESILPTAGTVRIENYIADMTGFLPTNYCIEENKNILNDEMEEERE